MPSGSLTEENTLDIVIHLSAFLMFKRLASTITGPMFGQMGREEKH